MPSEGWSDGHMSAFAVVIRALRKDNTCKSFIVDLQGEMRLYAPAIHCQQLRHDKDVLRAILLKHN